MWKKFVHMPKSLEHNLVRILSDSIKSTFAYLCVCLTIAYSSSIQFFHYVIIHRYLIQIQASHFLFVKQNLRTSIDRQRQNMEEK